MSLPLEGIRVVDFTQYQQGTVGTLMLADWGADVIKVEPRLVGEPGRTAGLAYYQAHNRNKRSITVDLKKERGKEIIYRLVKDADIFAQNFRPGVAERLGFGYEALSAINPRIIYLTGSGFGLKGPLKEKPGFDAVGQAMGGIMSLAGPPGSIDLPIGAAVADQTGGFMLGYGALLALFDRERTGKGQMVDASLMGSVIGLIGWIMQKGACRFRCFFLHPAGRGRKIFYHSDLWPGGKRKGFSGRGSGSERSQICDRGKDARKHTRIDRSFREILFYENAGRMPENSGASRCGLRTCL